MYFYQILLPLIFDKFFIYKSKNILNTGNIVKVEFGRQRLWAILINIIDQKDLPSIIDLEKLSIDKIKEIIEINDNIYFTPNICNFILQIANYNLASKGLIAKSFLNLLNKNKKNGKKSVINNNLKETSDKNKFNIDKYRNPRNLAFLSANQQEIADKICLNINNKDENRPILIDGVTGSGKTEIYFSIIDKILTNNQDWQILILLPEIALTSQLIARFNQQFGFEADLWHSQISDKNKQIIYNNINNGNVKIVIGARSALLLPFCNLKLIIVDEEHDPSFKQEDVVNFNARDMAIMYGAINKSKTLLLSATPSLESLNNALNNKYQYFRITGKYHRQNNVIKIIDMKNYPHLRNNKNAEIISPPLEKAINDSLVNQHQILLFLNRRGYAPLVICSICGNKYQCPNCDFHLVLHKNNKLLLCHHCGHQENINDKMNKKDKEEDRKKTIICKNCYQNHRDENQQPSLIAIGYGVERLYEEVKNKFNQARIAVITSDNIKNLQQGSDVIASIANNEIDIIIGTQMITKGYDFKNLKLVAVIEADSFFYSSELRTTERAYQMLTQVIGRSGRHNIAGEVMIQTHNPQNIIFNKIITGNSRDFYDFELQNRQILDLPPFSRMATIEISSVNDVEARKFANYLLNLFPHNNPKVKLLGPVSANIARLRNRHHFLIHIKVAKNINIQKIIKQILENTKIPRNIRIRVDIDPVN